jgi:hypothetical protein
VARRGRDHPVIRLNFAAGFRLVFVP